MHKQSVLIFCLLFISFQIKAQLRIDRVMPPSFNSSILMKYCDHPRGIKYGIPKIKHSIRTLINQDIYIPITLEYHTLGIKVEEEATWAGLGWNLRAGGYITRLIRGENDFGTVDFPETNKAKGYPFEHIKPCFDDCLENENAEFHAQVCEGLIDSDPDVFFFDILGMQGKFLLTPDHDINQETISIDVVSPRKMTFIFHIKENYWEIINKRGYKYTFKTREITEAHDNYFDYKYEMHKVLFDFYYRIGTTSWYLDEVVSPKGATAYFEYDVDAYDSSPYRSLSAFHKMNINDEDIWDVHYSSYCFPDNVENVQINSEYAHNDVYLSSITCGEYQVSFSKSNQVVVPLDHASDDSKENYHRFEITDPELGRQQLDKIEVTKNGELIQSADLKYSYFNEGVYSDDPYLMKRLRLDSLILTNPKKTTEIGFSYFEKVGLPSKESHARDLWGYFNGEEDLYNITPSDFFNYSQPEKLLQEEGKTRHYSLDHIKEGMLTGVEYKSGKKIEYIYDHQEFFNVTDEISSHFTSSMKNSNFQHHLKPFIFGGLRISEKVETYPKENIYKEYNYIQDGIDTGVLSISHYNHDHSGYGHKTSGNHTVKYKKVTIKSGKLFNGTKF